MASDIVRVLRIVEISGPRELVERQVANSIHGERLGAKSKDGQVVIRAATIGTYPEVLIFASAMVPELLPTSDEVSSGA